MEFSKRHFPFWAIVITVMTLTIGISVVTTTVLIQRDTVAESKQTTQNRILKVARATAKMPRVKAVIQASNHGSRATLQKYMKGLVKRDDVDFIVVMNRNLIRLSHPKARSVGHRFSSSTDPLPALAGETHFSQKAGVLGPESRVFYPVYRQGKVIGIVCVGVTQKKLHAQLTRRTRPILIGAVIGILVGAFLSGLLVMYLRYLLMGMEPSEISERTAQQALIENSLPEGIVAVNKRGVVISANQVAQNLFGQDVQVGQVLPAEIATMLLSKDSRVNGIEVGFRDKQLLISTNALVVREKELGQVALIRDMSEISGLLDKLAGTEHYVSSLRAQTHEFMNQLQVINGLLELEDYDEVLQFIQQITNSYHSDVGYISDKIKWPAVVGLLLGKSKEAKEQQVAFEITSDTYVPQLDLNSRVEILVLRIISNLVDNALSAFDAVQAEKQVRLKLAYLADSQQLVIQVSDNGSGITPTVREHMFQQGFSTKGEHRGYGMTLITAAVKDLDGSLEIVQNQPRGTIMTATVKMEEKSE